MVSPPSDSPEREAPGSYWERENSSAAIFAALPLEAAIFFSFAASFLRLSSTADGPGDHSLGTDPRSHSGLQGAVADPRSPISAQPQSLSQRPQQPCLAPGRLVG